MEIQEALKILRALANGTHPETGEALPPDSVCRNPQSIKALNRAISSLVSAEEWQKNRPANAFRYWSRAEEERICAELQQGLDFEQIAKAHDRSVSSIVARLAKLGKIAPKGSPPKAA
ncbi:MAG TPA: hypothetical protein VFA68_09845 [Terriglobales bacterium]|nr:hypothetical protein [Terriglobales bacterium]